MDGLQDRWATRDFPVLLAAARKVDALHLNVRASELADELGMSPDDVMSALIALDPTYVETKEDRRGPNILANVAVLRLTERGRRAVGLWPGEDSADALVRVLEAAADAEADPVEQGKLRKAAKAVGRVSRDVLVEIVAAVASRQMMGPG